MNSIQNSSYRLPGFSFLRSKSSFDGTSLASDKNDCKAESKNESKMDRKKYSSSSQVTWEGSVRHVAAGTLNPSVHLPAGQDSYRQGWLGIWKKEEIAISLVDF